MKKIAWLLLLLCFSVFAEKAPPTSFKVYGVSGSELTNVEKRLDELQHIKPLSSFTPEELQVQINRALQPFGYFKSSIDVRIINSAKVNITILPGPQVHIASLQVNLTGEGATNDRIKKTLLELPLHKGEPLLTEQYNKAKQNLTDTAENLGYLHASFKKAEIIIDENQNSAQITLVFDTGPLFYFGQVAFDPTYIKPELLHRFVPFHPGQPYSTEQVLKLNNHLSNSGYFSSVLVKPHITDSQTVPIAVHLQPVAKYSYSLGAGYGTDTGIRGRAGLYVIPVNRQGHKFNTIAQGSFNQNALQAQYIVPGRNPVTDQYTLTGNFSNLNYDAGYSNAYLLSLAQQHNLDNYKRALSINGLYESFNYTMQPNNHQFILYPKATFTFRKASNPLFSPTGYNVTFNGLGASQALLSKTSFIQGSVDIKAAYMIEPLRLRLYGHTIQGATAIKDINKLPLSLALLLGGMDNLKAFSFNSIGPGKIISYGGFEIQKEVVHNWYAIGFYDAGDVYDPAIKNAQYDVGAALMWVSPIGPIKIGIAQPVGSHMERVASNPRFVVNMGPDL